MPPRRGDWSSLLNPSDAEGQLVAKSKWGNGGGHKFSNSHGSGKCKNGKGGSKWINSHSGWRNGGWRFGSQIPVQVLLEPIEQGPPMH